MKGYKLKHYANRCREASHLWKGGRKIDNRGYVKVRFGKSEFYEHRLVISSIVCRPLLRTEQVHHKNGNKSDNRPENLEVHPSQKHHYLRHRSGKRPLKHPDDPNPVVFCLCACGQTTTQFNRKGKPRFFVAGHHNKMPRVRYDELVDELRPQFRL